MRAIISMPLILLAACDSSNRPPAPPPSPANVAPSFTSSATASIVENSTDAYQATATDANGDPITFSISGGADQAFFTITAGGALSFIDAPSFETPRDAGADNVYDVQLRASDGKLSATRDVAITVTNSREGIRVRRVTASLTDPVYVAPIPGSPHVFVIQKSGAIYHVDTANGTKSLRLTVGDLSTDGERGLLGLAVVPDDPERILVLCTAANGDVELRLYQLQLPFARGTLLATLATPHRDANNHNGGWLGFGPDGYLYVAIGDGGGTGDPANNAQNPNSRLGKILRVALGPAPDYFSPAPGNPYAGGGGDPYVFALGLRNPFRASFGPDGRLYIGDVGENSLEEIDVVRPDQPGLNFGWRFLEGTQPFSGTAPSGLTPPVSQYLHGNGAKEGNAIIGGYVYRGPVTSLQGRYVFGDFVSGNIWTVPSSELVQGSLLPAANYERRNLDFTPSSPMSATIDQIVSLGEDDAGNLYIVDMDGDIFVVESN